MDTKRKLSGIPRLTSIKSDYRVTNRGRKRWWRGENGGKEGKLKCGLLRDQHALFLVWVADSNTPASQGAGMRDVCVCVITMAGPRRQYRLGHVEGPQ